MPPRTPPATARMRRLAFELRQLRKAAELTRDDVFEQTGINRATLYRIETSRGRPQARTLKALMELYTVEPGKRAELAALLKEAGQRSWLLTFPVDLPEIYTAYIGFEDEAREIWNYESLFIPGLLQIEGYARSVIRGTLPEATTQEVEERVQARMQRQSVLSKTDPLRLWAIIDEAALHRQVGGAATMLEQVLHLRDSAQQPNITLQVIPFSAGAHTGMSGSFVVMQFADPVAPDIVYLDSTGGDLFLEEETDIRRHRLSFEHLRAVALSPDASTRLITRLAD